LELFPSRKFPSFDLLLMAVIFSFLLSFITLNWSRLGDKEWCWFSRWIMAVFRMIDFTIKRVKTFIGQSEDQINLSFCFRDEILRRNFDKLFSHMTTMSSDSCLTHIIYAQFSKHFVAYLPKAWVSRFLKYWICSTFKNVKYLPAATKENEGWNSTLRNTDSLLLRFTNT
jgi:hypothetical protein